MLNETAQEYDDDQEDRRQKEYEKEAKKTK